MSKTVLIFLGIIGLLSGCASVDRSQVGALDAWVGHGKGELVKEWGEPSTLLPLPDGGEALIYTRSHGGSDVAGQWSKTTTTTFYTGKDGRVASWRRG